MMESMVSSVLRRAAKRASTAQPCNHDDVHGLVTSQKRAFVETV